MQASQRIPQPPEPPPSAQAERRLQFFPLQLIGVPLIVVLPVLALLNVFGLSENQASARGPTLELVSLLLVPEIVSQALIREDYSITNGLVGLTTLFTLVFLTPS